MNIFDCREHLGCCFTTLIKYCIYRALLHTHGHTDNDVVLNMRMFAVARFSQINYE